MMYSTWSHVPGVRPCPEQHKPQLGGVSTISLPQEKQAGFAKSCSLPCRYHKVTYTLDGQHLALLLHTARGPEGAGETKYCRARLADSEETGTALLHSSCPKPFLHLQPNLPAAGRGKHHKFVPNPSARSVLAQHSWPHQAVLTDTARASSPVKRICMDTGCPPEHSGPFFPSLPQHSTFHLYPSRHTAEGRGALIPQLCKQKPSNGQKKAETPFPGGTSPSGTGLSQDGNPWRQGRGGCLPWRLARQNSYTWLHYRQNFT